MADVNQFLKVYESYFRKSLERERDVWYDFISKADESILRNAVDTLEEVFSAKKQGGFRVDAPSFPEVKREYFGMYYKAKGTGRKYCSPDCAQCEGIGTVRIVVHRPTGRILNPRTPEALSFGDLGILTADCSYAFAVKDKGRYWGWSLNRMENDIRIYVAICDNMYRKQNGLPLVPVDFNTVPQVEWACPACGGASKINAIPEGLEDDMSEMFARVVCDDCSSNEEAAKAREALK